jgi:lysophospholipase L1-like esterase
MIHQEVRRQLMKSGNGPLSRRAVPLLVVAGFLALGSGLLSAQSAPAAREIKPPESWESNIAAFEAAARKAPVPQNGVVFVGASSIVRWNLPEYFPELGAKAINRGFGGSLIGDSVHFADRIVIPYKPRAVVLYAGDNDVETTATAEQIADQFVKFDQKVHAALPTTEIILISIKPSIRRWAYIDKIRAANALMKAYIAKHPHLQYVDIVPQSIGADGRPRPELLVADGLHLTPEGYKVWTAALKPHLNED